VISYNHKSATVGGITRYRIQSVLSSFGYQINFEYENNSPTYGLQLATDWIERTRAIGINLAYHYCDRLGDTCAGGTFDWPEVQYSQPSGTTIERVTNALGQNTDYVFDSNMDYLVRVDRDSGEDAMRVTYDASNDDVDVLTVGGLSHDYSAPTLISGDRYYRDVVTRSAGVTTGNASTGWVRIEYQLDPRGIDKVTKYDSLTGATGSARYVEYTRNADNQVEAIADHTGRITEYTYDSRGNVTQVDRKATGQTTITTRAQYPSTCNSGNIAYCNKPEWTEDARGYRTDYTYYGHGGVATVTQPDPDGAAPYGSSSADRPQFTYEYTTRRAYYEMPSGGFGDGLATTVPSVMHYCAEGNNSCAGEARQTRQILGYEATGVANNILVNSIQTRSGDSSVSQTFGFDWDEYARPRYVDGPRAGTSDRTYFRHDALGRRITTNTPDPDGSGPLKHRATLIHYDNDGFVDYVEQGTMTSATGWSSFSSLYRITVDYDSWRRPIERTYVSGSTTHKVVHSSYDAAGRLECTAFRMTPTNFFSAGSACSQSGGATKDRIGRNHYSNFDEVLRVESGVGTSLVQDAQTMTYTSQGNIEFLTDAEGNETRYTYDTFGRLKTTEYPHKSVDGSQSGTDHEEVFYDVYGRVEKIELRDGNEVAYGYDNLGRRTLIDAPLSDPDTTMGYDKVGRLKTLSRAGQTLTYVYNALGQLESEAGPKGTVSYDYNAEGLRSRMDYPGAGSFYVTYEYNDAGDLTAINEGASTVLAEFTYDDYGRRKTLERGNGVDTTYTFDAAGDLDSLVNDLVGTSDDVTLSFDYNVASQITERTTSNADYEWDNYTAFTDGYVSNGLNRTPRSTG
jgi:YD repeat-containing protein